MPITDMPPKKRYKVNLPEQQMTCELNYRRLLSLVPNVIELPVTSNHVLALGDMTTVETIIEISVVEQTKYTSVVHIVQYYPLQRAVSSIKNHLGHQQLYLYQVDVRLYHDVAMAEVVKCQRYHQFQPRYDYPNIKMHQINEKVQLNRFLGELLIHVSRHGRVMDAGLDRLFTVNSTRNE